MFVFTQSSGLFTVGCFNDNNVWFPARDFNDQDAAEQFCSYINGGSKPLGTNLKHATLICQPDALPIITFDCPTSKLRDQLTRRALDGYSPDTKFFALTGEGGFCPKVERFEEYQLHPGRRMFVGNCVERNLDVEYRSSFVFYAKEDTVEDEFEVALLTYFGNEGTVEDALNKEWYNLDGHRSFRGDGFSIVNRHEEFTVRKYI